MAESENRGFNKDVENWRKQEQRNILEVEFTGFGKLL